MINPTPYHAGAEPKSNFTMRIHGSRVWIEIACQSGVVLSGTHYHSMMRDQYYDYGNSL
jgi:hypothetical protein